MAKISHTFDRRDNQGIGVFGVDVLLDSRQNEQTVEYVITNSESPVPNDRVRAFALWEGWFGYDRRKNAEMLRDAFEPFALCIPKTPEIVLLHDDLSEEELKRFPLFAALLPLRP